MIQQNLQQLYNQLALHQQLLKLLNPLKRRKKHKNLLILLLRILTNQKPKKTADLIIPHQTQRTSQRWNLQNQRKQVNLLSLPLIFRHQVFRAHSHQDKKAFFPLENRPLALPVTLQPANLSPLLVLVILLLVRSNSMFLLVHQVVLVKVPNQLLLLRLLLLLPGKKMKTLCSRIPCAFITLAMKKNKNQAKKKHLKAPKTLIRQRMTAKRVLELKKLQIRTEKLFNLKRNGLKEEEAN
mmetsp:Transcript_15934/g.20305  ORF Transcript_15934/g.20305 Transcript_15934/m.20305 type:complete len:239 (+) Transcript_15934:215-931(+)